MENITVVRVVRQVRLVTFVRQQPAAGYCTPLVTAQPQPALPPPPRTNNKGLNAFVLLILYIIGIGSIVLGAVHINDCPAEKMLPTGLIVFGGLIMVGRLLNCVYDCRSVCEEDCSEDTPPCLVLLNVLFFLVEFGMFIAVCYWVFSISPTTEPGNHALKNYCDKGLYNTSFYGCIIGLIIYAIPFCCGCCAAACSN